MPVLGLDPLFLCQLERIEQKRKILQASVVIRGCMPDRYSCHKLMKLHIGDHVTWTHS